MSKEHIAVIDYGMGNLHSAAKAIEYASPNAIVTITSDAQVIRDADRIVFPGVGAIRDCMHEIVNNNFDTLIQQQINEKPTLAICVGMQALMKSSAENGGVNCINVFDDNVQFFNDQPEITNASPAPLKVPHMGWNTVSQTLDHPVWHGIQNHSRFYFVHSYYIPVSDNAYMAGVSEYGVNVVAAVAKGNLFATQFHPEKSHETGLTLIKNFTQWTP